MVAVDEDWEEIGSETSAACHVAPIRMTDMQLGPMIKARGNELISGYLHNRGGGRSCQGGDGGCLGFPAPRNSAFALGSFFRRVQGVDALALQALLDDITQMANQREGELVDECRRLQDAHEALREESDSLRRLLNTWDPKAINEELCSESTSLDGKNAPSLYSFDARSTCVEEGTEMEMSSVRSEDTFATSPSFFGDFVAPYIRGGPPSSGSSSHTGSINSEDSEEDDEGFGTLKCRGVKKGGGGAVTPTSSKDGRPKQIAHIRIRDQSTRGLSSQSRGSGGDTFGEDVMSEHSDEDGNELGGVCSENRAMEPILERWESRPVTNVSSLTTNGSRMSGGPGGMPPRGSRKRRLQGQRVKQGFEAAMNYRKNAARLLKGRCDGPIRHGKITTFSI